MTLHEPAPQKVAPPSVQPLLRVGVLIEEDDRKEIRFGVDGEGYLLEGSALPPGFVYSASLDGDEITVAGPGFLRPSGNLVRIEAPPRQILSKGAGIRLHGLRVGRDFHWQKEIDQSFLGAVEILSERGRLVVVNEISFEDYIASVITSEMASGCPLEFLKAQAVAARSWAYVFLRNKHPGRRYSICNDDCCQRYQGTTFARSACNYETRGEFLVNAGGWVCPTYYSKCCGGVSELPRTIFGFDFDGLSVVYDSAIPRQPDAATEKWIAEGDSNDFCNLPPQTLRGALGGVDESGSYYRWRDSISRDELSRVVREKCGLPDLVSVLELVPLLRGASGRITKMDILYTHGAGGHRRHHLENQYEIRKALHPSFLLSSSFVHRWEGDKLVLAGAGWGHGVGLCQLGGVGMALKGYDYRQILSHYFPQTSLVLAYGST